MADPKGFLTIPRRDRARRPVRERVEDWREVYEQEGLLPLVTEQARRCMDCGVPFCHSGCPLGNLIPDWNIRVSHEDWRAASELLHATNNFPEFTGRLCPAPCETGCVLAINADPVTIKNVEVAIADRAWDHGDVRPQPPERLSGRTVAVIGSGPAGLAAAQQLTRAGHTVAVYERDDRPGGLLRYGIPEFKMEKGVLERRLDQMRAEGTRFRTGVDVGHTMDASELLERFDAVLVATGALAPRDLAVPGRELTGIHQAMDYLTLANRVQEGDLDASPVSAEGLEVVIIGGGDTGADCLGTAVRQRAASIVQLDINPRPGPERPPHQPWPVHPRVHRMSPAHEEAGALMSPPEAGRDRAPDDSGDVRLFSASTVRFEGDEQGRVRAIHVVGVTPGDRRPVPDAELEIPARMVLLALGFTGPEPDSPLIDQLGLRFSARGTISRDAEYRTGIPGVFVAGDAGRGQSLIVWAIAEGRAAAASVDHWLTGSSDLHAPVRATDRPLTV